jgi:hypothetical protein
MSDHKNTIRLQDIPAETAAARERTGRHVGDILADLVSVTMHGQDLAARRKQIGAQATADNDQVQQKLGALLASAKPADIKTSGVVVRRADPAAAARALNDGLTARLKQRVAEAEAVAAREDQLQPLVAELVAELGRAGVPAGEVQALVNSATITRASRPE